MANFRALAEAIVDLVFPMKCVACGTLGPEALCGICFSNFEGHEPSVHKADDPLDYAGALFDYSGPAAATVQSLKYRRATSAAAWMAASMAAGLADRGLEQVDMIVPVPIHWSRLAIRGFNQSELLCLSMPSKLLRSDVLRRRKATRPQVGLSPEERSTNLEDAFEVTSAVAGLSVLLVDDVLTSGGTARECAATLKRAGAGEVGILAFAAEPRWRH